VPRPQVVASKADVVRPSRFFFDLAGGQKVTDEYGLPFKDQTTALRVARKMARDLAQTRPELRGNTWIVVRSAATDELWRVDI